MLSLGVIHGENTRWRYRALGDAEPYSMPYRNPGLRQLYYTQVHLCVMGVIMALIKRVLVPQSFLNVDGYSCAFSEKGFSEMCLSSFRKTLERLE